jgi:hypothetical protein
MPRSNADRRVSRPSYAPSIDKNSGPLHQNISSSPRCPAKDARRSRRKPRHRTEQTLWRADDCRPPSCVSSCSSLPGTSRSLSPVFFNAPASSGRAFTEVESRKTTVIRLFVIRSSWRA